MKKLLFLLVVLLVFSIPGVFGFAGGNGSSESPYMISNCEELQSVKDSGVGSPRSFIVAHFVLVNDIDCSDTVNWNNGSGFIPLSKTNQYEFSGSFDGQGHVIKNLFINRPSVSEQALFGNTWLRSGAPAPVIKNVGLVNVSVTGYWSSGGLVGRCRQAVINNTFVTGYVNGNTPVGGLVGDNDCTIYNSYTDVFLPSVVNGAGFMVGGAAYNSYSLSTLTISGAGSAYSFSNGGVCVGCFWDMNISSRASGCGAVGLSTDEMKDIDTFLAANWSIAEGLDFDYSWGIDDDVNNGYPFLTVFYTVKGCTDSEALNYDSEADFDDNTCYYNPGCNDPNASNFDEEADFDDGSCEYPRSSGGGGAWPDEEEEESVTVLVAPSSSSDNGALLSLLNQDGEVDSSFVIVGLVLLFFVVGYFLLRKNKRRKK